MFNKLVLFVLIFILNVGFSLPSYSQRIEEITDTLMTSRKGVFVQPVFISDIKNFFNQKENSNTPVILLFYPKGSGFDCLVENDDQFLQIKEVLELAQEAGWRVNYCMPHRHMASFADEDELKNFVHTTFGAELKRANFPLFFPTKIVILELLAQKKVNLN